MKLVGIELTSFNLMVIVWLGLLLIFGIAGTIYWAVLKYKNDTRDRYYRY